MKKNKVLEILYIILGSIIVSFAVCYIHSKTQLTEGGQIGVELLLQHWFNISPTYSSVFIDFLFYILGFIILNKKFRINAIIGTFSYSISFFIFERVNFTLPFLNNIFVSSIIGGILVGIGCGIVVRHIGSCGGDDSLALILNKVLKLPLFICYFAVDIIVIIISLSYIKISIIPYSIFTSFISSLIIDLIARKRIN